MSPPRSSSSSSSTDPNRKKKKQPKWSNLWLKSTNSFKHVVVSMQLNNSHSNPNPKSQPQPQSQPPRHSFTAGTNTTSLSSNGKVKDETLIFYRPPSADITLLLPDQIMHRIFSYLADSDSNSLYLVCKRWLNLQGRLIRFLRVLDYHFLVSGRLVSRFPNLIHVDLIDGCVLSSSSSRLDSYVVLSCGDLCFRLDSNVHSEHDSVARMSVLNDSKFVSEEAIDKALISVANGYPNLRKLTTFAGSELGLMSVAEECPYLQQLELHKCSDSALRGIIGCKNLQILKLVGNVDGLYFKESSITDIGLTILAQGCKRLVKLELSGCEGSFDGIKAIAQCCQMLEELSLCDHRMEDGWLVALSHFENLRSLKFSSCKKIDLIPGPDEYLGFCQTLEFLHLHKCHLRNKESVKALFAVCKAVKDIKIQDCWGLDDDTFSLAQTCRDVKSLSIEGTSLLTTKGLESVLLSWTELEKLRVISCNEIKENEVSSQLSNLLPLLQDFKWMPDTKARLSSYTAAASGKKGSKFFRKSQILKSL